MARIRTSFSPCDQLSRADIELALGEARGKERSALLKELNAAPSEKFFLVDGGDDIDAKPIIQLAWNLRYPEDPITASHQFRGEARTVSHPLRKMGFWVEDRSESVDRDQPLGGHAALYIERAQQLPCDDLDRMSWRASRREQQVLRGALGLYETHELPCGICGRLLPTWLLVAAHIKPRAMCTIQERRDIPAVAFAACQLGCDRLFEEGWLSVFDGQVVASARARSNTALAPYVASVEGRTVTLSDARSAQYFEWHRQHSFVG